MAGCAIEIKVVFFDVLSVISFLASQSEGAFLQERIAPIPQGKRETEILVAIADSTETVFVSTDKHGNGHARAGNSPRLYRRDCSPLAQFPKHARRERAPNGSNERSSGGSD